MSQREKRQLGPSHCPRNANVSILHQSLVHWRNKNQEINAFRQAEMLNTLPVRGHSTLPDPFPPLGEFLSAFVE